MDKIVSELESLKLTKKKKFGQFFTTKWEKIFRGMSIPKDTKKIIEPFAGNGDLLNFVEKKDVEIIMYDVDPKIDGTIKQDTIKEPPTYTGTYVLTNPPYLANNKTMGVEKKKQCKEQNVDDLYKLFISQLIDDPPDGGIIIIPINFLSSVRKNDISLRKKWFSTFIIQTINIFEEPVFSDTSYAVCAIQFKLNTDKEKYITNVVFYPSGDEKQIDILDNSKVIIGGHIHDFPKKSNVKISRATSKNKSSDGLSNIKIRCLDNNKDVMISAIIVENDDIFIDETKRLSARTFMSPVFDPPVDKKIQKVLVKEFNEIMKTNRSEYRSMFLSTYREGKNGFLRKRITFTLIYQILHHILEKQPMNSD